MAYHGKLEQEFIAAIDNDDAAAIEVLTKSGRSNDCKHIHCNELQHAADENKPTYCSMLLERAVRNKRMRAISYMLAAGFPTDMTSLILAVHQDDPSLLKRLYEAGCRFRKHEHLFYYKRIPSLETVKTAVECGFSMLGELRNIIEYAPDDVLEWAYPHICSLEIPTDAEPKEEVLIGPYGYQKTTSDPRFGWGLYDAAINHGTLLRFMFVVGLPIDRSFWESLLSDRPVTNTIYTKEDWASKRLERAKIIDWCIENSFCLDSDALACAILYKHKALTAFLMDRKVPVTPKVMSNALLAWDLPACKGLYKGPECLSESVWLSAAIDCSQEKLEWLIEIGCPRPERLIQAIIDEAPTERLEWLVEKGFKPTIGCWAMLSDRYMLYDTDEMLEWLWAKGCPLDHEIANHLDINRPFARDIVDFVKEKL